MQKCCRFIDWRAVYHTDVGSKDKCVEAVRELNASIEVGNEKFSAVKVLLMRSQAICAAGQEINIAAELFASYRRNVEWNLKQHPMPDPVLLGPPPSERKLGSSPET